MDENICAFRQDSNLVANRCVPADGHDPIRRLDPIADRRPYRVVLYLHGGQEVEKATPLGRWGGDQEIVKTIIALIESDFITGETIRVDGGRHLR